jgi:hypothetical protein
MSDAERMNVYSTAIESECRIDSMWVCVFDGTSKAKRFVEKIEGDQIMHNGQATQLLPQLKHKINTGDIVVCIANADATTSDTTNVTLDNIDACFRMNSRYGDYYLGGQSLPMYGEIAGWSDAGKYTCPMTRAVAKVQVQLGASFVSPVYYNGRPVDEKHLMWRMANFPGNGYIQPKSTPAGRTAWAGRLLTNPTNQGTLSSVLLQKEGAPEAERTNYVHEFQSSIYRIDDITAINRLDDTKFDAGRPCIIFGYSDGGNTSFTHRHFRLDFYDHAEKKYMDIRRNHHYLFTINRIGSEGYGEYTDGLNHFEEVLNNPPSNIEYTVYVKDNARSITSNGQYAVVTSVDTVWITDDVTNQTVATYRYINPTELDSLPIMMDTIYVRSSNYIKPNTATLTITSPLQGGSHPLPITATKGKDNHELKITTTGSLDSTDIHFRFGGIRHRLPVRRRPQQP